MSLLRRRLMEDIPKTEPKGNVVKVVLRVSMDDSSNAPIFDVGFDISQVKYIRFVDADIELDVGYTLDLFSGDYKLEIGLNVLTNGDSMFYGVNLLYCDFSDVDISNMYSARYMFAYTNIDKPPFLSLPDVTLTPNCFEGMFMGCASLVYAPVLPSRTLVDGCYKNMFNGCTSLIFVKALFDDNPYEEVWPPTEDWMLNVASEGTFVMSKDASFSESEFRGVSGIPEGWSVVSSDELVNGKVVNNLSIYYGNKNFIGYQTILQSQFPVVSLIYIAGDGVVSSESVVFLRGLSIGETSSPASFLDEIPLTNIVSGPKEDDCFSYEFADAIDDKELIVISVELENDDSNYTYVYAEKGMTWGEFADSRYTEVSPFYSDGVYIHYNTTDYLYHGDYEKVKNEDLIDTEKYYFVDSEY